VGVGVGIINPHVKFMIDAWIGAIIIGVAFIKKIKHVRAGKNLQELKTSLSI
jgi:tryptophan synthase alpha subunit